jgi:AhpC/TSA family
MAEFPLRRTSFVLELIVIATITGCGTAFSTPDGAERHTTGTAVSGALLDLNGQEFDLWQNDGDSAATVLLFARTDCPISNRYAPTVKTLYEMYQPRRLRIYLVYVDPDESPDEIRRHLNEYKYPCTGLRDPTHALVKATGVTVTPEAVLYDAKHEIVYRGRINDLYAAYGQSRDTATTHDLADAIESTLAGKPVAEPTTEAVGCPIADLR